MIDYTNYNIPHFDNQTWIFDSDGTKYCAFHPDDKRCDIVPGNYAYKISMPANAIFMAIFAASLVAYISTWVITRRAGVFTIALSLGLICEVIGYGGRIMSISNPWVGDGFIMQLCCLTIGPAFMAAGLYLCLRRIVRCYGADISRIPPAYYTRIFIPCDVIALVLQATGGALASINSSDPAALTTGTNIMIAGLAFQVATIVGFLIAGADFAVRVRQRIKYRGENGLNQDIRMVELRNRKSFKAFMYALGAFALLILWRSSFRVAELCNGWHGSIIENQTMFIVFEGVVIAVAVALLNVFHPALFARQLFETRAEKRAGDHKGTYMETKQTAYNSGEEMNLNSETGYGA